MKKITFFLLFTIVFSGLQAQTVIGDLIQAYRTFKLNGKYINHISNDTTFTIADSFSIPTAFAVWKFVNNHAGSGGGPASTDYLSEGSTNKYFTDTRARSVLAAGSGITYNSTTGVITKKKPDWNAASGNESEILNKPDLAGFAQTWELSAAVDTLNLRAILAKGSTATDKSISVSTISAREPGGNGIGTGWSLTEGGSLAFAKGYTKYVNIGMRNVDSTYYIQLPQLHLPQTGYDNNVVMPVTVNGVGADVNGNIHISTGEGGANVDSLGAIVDTKLAASDTAGKWLSVSTTIPTKTSDLANDAGFINSVPAQSWASITGKPIIPTSTTQLTNDAGFISSESDPSVSAAAKAITSTDVSNWNSKASDNSVVHLTGNENITGDKIFNNSLKISTNTNVSWGNNFNYGVLTWDAGKAIINTTAGNSLVLKTASNDAITIDLTGTATVRGNIKPAAANSAASAPIMSQIYPSNKKWCIFGDSFSASLVSGYPANVISRILFTGTATNAVSGNKINQQSAKLDSILTASPNYFSAFDIVSILIGVNDFAASTALGTYTDTAGASTYVGYLKHMIESILTKKPTIELYIMTAPEGNGAGVPYKGVNSAGWTLAKLSEVIKQVCRQYAVQVIDLYNLSGFNQLTIPSLTMDGLHPNTAGASIIGNIVANGFMNKNNNSTNNADSIAVLRDSIAVLRGQLAAKLDSSYKDTVNVTGAILYTDKTISVDTVSNLKDGVLLAGYKTASGDTLSTRAYARSVAGSGGALPDLSARDYANDSLAYLAGVHQWDLYRTGNTVKVLTTVPNVDTSQNLHLLLKVESGYADSISLQLYNTTAFTTTVYWGDGSHDDNVSKDNLLNHKYASAGTYYINLIPSSYSAVSDFYIYNQTNKMQILDVGRFNKLTALKVFQVTNLVKKDWLDSIPFPSGIQYITITKSGLTGYSRAVASGVKTLNLNNNSLTGFTTTLPAGLTILDFSANGWNTSGVNDFLVWLDSQTFNAGAKTLNVKQFNSAVPSGAGATAKTSLEGKGWTITTD